MSKLEDRGDCYEYTVQPGDYLCKIAALPDINMPWKDLRDEQGPKFYEKNRGKNNDLIWPGEFLKVPKVKPKEYPKSLDTTHRFFTQREVTALTVHLQLDEQPLKGANYSFQLWDSDDTQPGTTNGEGEATVDVRGIKEGENGPVGFGYLRVEIPKNEDFKRYHTCGLEFMVFCLFFGHMHPMGEPELPETQKALIARLVNLGYVPGATDDDPKEGLLRLAIRHFYRQHMKEKEDPSAELNDKCCQDVQMIHQV